MEGEQQGTVHRPQAEIREKAGLTGQVQLCVCGGAWRDSELPSLHPFDILSTFQLVSSPKSQ